MKIDGALLAQTLLENLKTEVSNLKQSNKTSMLAVILVGDDPASEAYVRQKKIKGESIGIQVSIFRYAKETTEKELLKKIEELNKDQHVSGIIIQQPLPRHINPEVLVTATNPQKDVDGFHPESKFSPPIAEAVLEILKEIAKQNNFGIQEYLMGKTVVVVGKGPTGGTPIKEIFAENGVNTQVIDSKTPNPEEITGKADIIVSCVGKQGVLKKKNLKQGVVLISVGMSQGSDGRLHGDYNEEEIKDTASFYTPVPGGVGPVNVAMLLKNIIEASRKS